MSIIRDAVSDSFVDAMRQSVHAGEWRDVRQVKLGAKIGSALLVSVPDADRVYPGEVYYTELDNTGYGRAINRTGGGVAGQRVEIGKPPDDPNTFYVRTVLVQASIANTAGAGVVPPAEASISRHAAQHSLRGIGWTGTSSTGVTGTDPVMVDDRQMWSLGIIPTGSGVQAIVAPGWIMFNGTRKWFNGSLMADWLADVPTEAGKAFFRLIEIDSGLNIVTTDGSLFNVGLAAGTLDTNIPANNAARYTVGAVILRNGMTELTFSHIWPGMNSHIVGASGGGSDSLFLAWRGL